MAGGQSIERLVRAFMAFPGIGRRSAERIVYFLMADPERRIHTLLDALSSVVELVHRCPVCNNFAEEELCPICRETKRNRRILCVLAEPRDLEAIEKTGAFRGLYHVLGGLLSPLDGIGPSELSIDTLIKRVHAEKPAEVVLALSSTVEGDATASYLMEVLGPSGVRISRLARGVPAGGSLEYLDQRTLSHAVEGRETISRA